jgi:WD40 repeat protein
MPAEFFGAFRMPAYLGEQGGERHLLRFSPNGSWLAAGATLIATFPVPDGSAPHPFPVAAPDSPPPDFGNDLAGESVFLALREEIHSMVPFLEGVPVPDTGVFSWIEPAERFGEQETPPEYTPILPDDYIKVNSNGIFALADGSRRTISFDPDHAQARAVAASRGGEWLALATWKTLRVWKSGTEPVWTVEPAWCIEAVGGRVVDYRTLAFSPDGRRLAAAGAWEAEGVGLWDLETRPRTPIDVGAVWLTEDSSTTLSWTELESPEPPAGKGFVLEGETLRHPASDASYAPPGGGRISAVAAIGGTSLFILEKGVYTASLVHWDPTNPAAARRVTLPRPSNEWMNGLMATPDGTRLFLFNDSAGDAELYCFDADTLKPLLQHHAGILPNRAAFDAEGRRLYLANESVQMALDGATP